MCLSSYHTQRNTKLESDQRGTPKNLFFLICMFLGISRNSLVGDELPPDDPVLYRSFRVPAEEPPAKNSVK